jgi:FeS assembly SUF system protein
MSSPLSSDPLDDRIIPLADVPPPAARPDEPTTELRDEGTFTADPLNTLKFQPHIVEAISKVFDPEIPVNIYELGLIYDIDVDSAANVKIRMTLTAPACPSAQTIPLEVERRVQEVAGVGTVSVVVVWDPPWTRDRMSEIAKLTLGMY